MLSRVAAGLRFSPREGSLYRDIPEDDERLVTNLDTRRLMIFDDMMGVTLFSPLWIGLLVKLIIETPV